MKAVIRISGMVNNTGKLEETLYRLRLRRKYSAVILKESPELEKILILIRNHTAYGHIDDETLKLLIQKRAMPINKSKKIDVKKTIEQLEKGLSDIDIKPFFRLHPPRGGIDAKKHFGTTKKAVLGDNKDSINELIRRML